MNRRTTSKRFGGCCSLRLVCDADSRRPTSDWRRISIERGVTLEHLQRAIWLGCARKYVAMLNGQPPMPITSLRYFSGLVEEVGQTEVSDHYWLHVRSKAEQLERQWLQRQGGDTALR